MKPKSTPVAPAIRPVSEGVKAAITKLDIQKVDPAKIVAIKLSRIETTLIGEGDRLRALMTTLNKDAGQAEKDLAKAIAAAAEEAGKPEVADLVKSMEKFFVKPHAKFQGFLADGKGGRYSTSDDTTGPGIKLGISADICVTRPKRAGYAGDEDECVLRFTAKVISLPENVVALQAKIKQLRDEYQAAQTRAVEVQYALSRMGVVERQLNGRVAEMQVVAQGGEDLLLALDGVEITGVPNLKALMAPQQ